MTQPKRPKFHRVWVRIKNAKPKRWRRGWRKNPTWRDNIVTAMRWMIANEPQIHYLQQRPFSPRKVADRTLPISIDCSGSTTQLYYAVGMPDPNGNHYDGTGYTGTLREHMPFKPLAKLQPGDLIIYGIGAGTHVVVVLEPHPTDPLCFSHGQERGPIAIRHSVEVGVHGRYFTTHGWVDA